MCQGVRVWQSNQLKKFLNLLIKIIYHDFFFLFTHLLPSALIRGDIITATKGPYLYSNQSNLLSRSKIAKIAGSF